MIPLLEIYRFMVLILKSFTKYKILVVNMLQRTFFFFIFKNSEYALSQNISFQINIRLSYTCISFEYLISCIKVGIDSRSLNVRWLAQSDNTFFFSFNVESCSLNPLFSEYTRFEQ